MDKVIYTCGFRFNETKDKVLLIQKDKPEWQKGLLNGIGGKLEGDEDIYQCIEREFEEEADLGTYDEWRKFAVLNIERDGSPLIIVHFLVSIGRDIDFYKGTEFKTDEGIVKLYDYPDVLFDDKNPLIYNLNYLLPMALDDDLNVAAITQK